MSTEFSRRQSLKLMAGAGLFSAMPAAAVSELVTPINTEPVHAYVIAGEGSANNAFVQAVTKTLAVNVFDLTHKRHESILALSQLPKGTLILGLVNEAEKVLIDALVQDRKGLVNTTARVNYLELNNSNAAIPELAEMTVLTALSKTNAGNVEQLPAGDSTAASLIRFYAYV